MALMVCRRCGTVFAVGLSRCPNCTAEDAYQQGEEDGMPKISVHGGPSNAAEELEASDRAGASNEESAPPVVVGGEAPAPDPEEPATVKALQEALRRLGQPTSGSKDELLERWRAATSKPAEDGEDVEEHESE